MKIYHIRDTQNLHRAGPKDLVELFPAPGQNPMILPRLVLDVLVYAIVYAQYVHLSGPTGSGKTSLIEALWKVPENFQLLCRLLGFEYKPLLCFPIESVMFETPGDYLSRTGIRNGNDYEKPSTLVKALQACEEAWDDNYCAIWQREIGRQFASSTQSGVLNLMSPSSVTLPDGRQINTGGICFLADSNYAAESGYMLVQMDRAYRRRYQINLTLEYPDQDQEMAILHHLAKQEGLRVREDVVARVVKLGSRVREEQAEGNLTSITDATLYGYLGLVRMLSFLPHLSFQQAAEATLLGHAVGEDREMISSMFHVADKQNSDDLLRF